MPTTAPRDSGGAQKALLGKVHEEDLTVYMRVDTCVGNHYGAMHRDVLVDFIKDNKARLRNHPDLS